MHLDQLQLSGGRLHLIATLTAGLANGVWQRHCEEAWDKLIIAFGVVGPSQIFTDFHKVITYRVWSHNLAPDILEIAKAFGHLMAAKVVIPSITQLMTLLSALPVELEHITQMYLQVTEIADFKFTEIQEGILAEHAWKQNREGSKQIQKLSNVKCKRDNPKWKPHADRQNDQKGDWSSKKQRGKKSGWS